MSTDSPLSATVRSCISAEEWQARIDLAACYRLLEVLDSVDLSFRN